MVIAAAVFIGSCGSGGSSELGLNTDSTQGSGVPADPDPSDGTPTGSSLEEGIFPRSPAPGDRIDVVDLTRLYHLLEQNQETIAFMTLAGLVNRSEPRIYLASSKEDPWPEWMRERGDIEAYDWLSNPYDLFASYGAEANGLVVVDPGISATYNVACVVAACEGLIACHPNYVSRIRERNPSLLVVRDLREEHFAHNGEAYNWAYQRYWNQMRHDVLAWIDTSYRPSGPRDYCVAHKIFPLWVNGYALPWEPGIQVQAEQDFAEKVLAETPDNIPILGWPGTSRGLGEHEGIKLWSRYAKYAVYEGELTGLSFHSGCSPVSMGAFPSSELPAFDIDKTYYATYHSEGELLWDEAPFRAPWLQKTRGEIPYGWSIGLLQQELIPAPLDWFFQGDGSTRPIQAEDELMSAMSGLGYVFPQYYPDKARKGFLEMTRAYLASNGITTLAIHFLDAKYPEKREITEEYGDLLGPSVDAIFAEYTYRPRMTYGQTNYLSDGVPTFHALAPGYKKGGTDYEDTARQFHQRLHDRGAPAFGEIFLVGWNSGPDKAVRLRDALNGLGGPDTYVPVRPDQLGSLYEESGAGMPLGFVDDFSKGDENWIVESGSWSPRAGAYVQDDTAPTWHVARAGNCQWDNIAVSAVLRSSDVGDSAGMAVYGRFRGMNNAYYRFELRRDSAGGHARLFKKTRGATPSLLAATPQAWNPGQDVVLKLVVHCDTIVCSLDGSEVLRFVDTNPIPRGWVALGSYGGKTRVDDVRVERSLPCVDCDGDGYGAPGDASCEAGADWDCDDYDGDELPGGLEGPGSDPSCTDGLDNDCDGLFDADDPDCQ